MSSPHGRNRQTNKLRCSCLTYERSLFWTSLTTIFMWTAEDLIRTIFFVVYRITVLSKITRTTQPSVCNLGFFLFICLFSKSSARSMAALSLLVPSFQHHPAQTELTDIMPRLLLLGDICLPFFRLCNTNLQCRVENRENLFFGSFWCQSPWSCTNT